MFSEERERWKKFFDIFKKHFNEEVGFVPSVYESEHIDIDFILGEESGKLYGIQVMQLFPDEEYESEDDEDDEEEDNDEDIEDEVDDEEEEDVDDEDEPTGYVIEYTFIITDKKIEDIKEEKIYDLDFEMESEEEKEQVHLDFYAKDDDEFTAIVVYINEEYYGVFTEHPDFDF